MKKKIIKCKTRLDLDYFAQVPGLKVNFTKNYKMFRLQKNDFTSHSRK